MLLYNNQLTSVPAEIGQLTSLEELYLWNNRLTSVPAEIGQLTSLACVTDKKSPSADKCRRRQRAAHVAAARVGRPTS